jgi:hypothetical protein
MACTGISCDTIKGTIKDKAKQNKGAISSGDGMSSGVLREINNSYLVP